MSGTDQLGESATDLGLQSGTTRRRLFAAAAATAISSLMQAAPVQNRTHRIGILGVYDSRVSEWWPALLGELARQGFVEDKTIAFISRTCGEQLERLIPLARELVDQVEIVISTATEATPALRQATQTVPIVMIASEDPVRDGLIASLAHPGGNITGNTVSSHEIVLKQLDLLIEVLGAPKRIAYVLYEPFRSRPFEIQLGIRLAAAASSRGVRVETYGADGSVLNQTFEEIGRRRFDGIVLHNHATIGLESDEVGAIVLRHRIPTIMAVRSYARAGVPLTFGYDLSELFRKTGAYVARILSGAKAADLPVELATKFELVVNLKSASALGLKVPQSILVRASEILQ